MLFETEHLRELLSRAAGYVGFFAEALDPDSEDVELYEEIKRALDGTAYALE